MEGGRLAHPRKDQENKLGHAGLLEAAGRSKVRCKEQEDGRDGEKAK
jgi:hypothetical protein